MRVSSRPGAECAETAAARPHRELPDLGAGPRIDRVEVRAFVIPAETPESDGTLAWDSTTMVLVALHAGDSVGIGYTYADRAAGPLIANKLAPIIVGRSPWASAAIWKSMVEAVRNTGRPGIASTAISAVDLAMWDLKGRLLRLPLADLLGRAHRHVPAYGSGGFTSYSIGELTRQLSGWAADGFRAVKMKVGREPGDDPRRVAAARDAIGPDVGLMVDANGAYDRRRAVASALAFGESHVTWFEEPVSSDDPRGLRFVRDHAPGEMAIAAGEYAWGPDAFRELVVTDAVDVLQADATRCGGVTGFLIASSVAETFHVPLSAHCAPSIHASLMAACRPAMNLEWFHDHVRIERLLLSGAPDALDGFIGPSPDRPGLGLELKRSDSDRFLVWHAG